MAVVSQHNLVRFQALDITESDRDFTIRGAEPSEFEQIVTIVNEAYWAQQKAFFIDSDLSRTRTTLSDLR